MKGRPPVPTALRILHGNPSRRPLNEEEPKPETEIPECPDGLDKVGQDEWERITGHLYQLNMVADMDLAVLYGYCHSFEQFIKSATDLKKTGFLVKAPSGYPIVNPLLSINNKAKAMMLKFAQELGLSVVQRTKIKIEGNGKREDEFDSFLRKNDRKVG